MTDRQINGRMDRQTDRELAEQTYDHVKFGIHTTGVQGSCSQTAVHTRWQS